MAEKKAGGKASPKKKPEEEDPPPDPTATVTLICGANRMEVAGYVGKTVEDVRKAHKEVLNIPEDKVRVLVRGDDMDDDYELRQGDVVDFLRAAGTKGQG